MRQILFAAVLILGLPSSGLAQETVFPSQTATPGDAVHEAFVWGSRVYRLNRHTGAVDEMMVKNDIADWHSCAIEDPITEFESTPRARFQFLTTRFAGRTFLLFDTLTGRTWVAEFDPIDESVRGAGIKTIWRPLSARPRINRIR